MSLLPLSVFVLMARHMVISGLPEGFAKVIRYLPIYAYSMLRLLHLYWLGKSRMVGFVVCPLVSMPLVFLTCFLLMTLSCFVKLNRRK